jgi:hypothetical protein
MNKISVRFSSRTRWRLRRVSRLFVVATLAVIAIPTPAAAYIDPVSGSVLLQILSAAVLAGAVTIGRARTWILSLFRRRDDRTEPGVE